MRRKTHRDTHMTLRTLWASHHDIILFFGIALLLVVLVFAAWVVLGQGHQTLSRFVVRHSPDTRLTADDLRENVQGETVAHTVKEVTSDMTLTQQQEVYQHAHNLYLVGEYEKSAAQYAVLVAAFDDDARLHNDYGNVLRDIGYTDQAEEQYRRAIDLDGKLLTAYANLAYLLMARGDDEAARDVIASGVRRNPSSEDFKIIAEPFSL